MRIFRLLATPAILIGLLIFLYWGATQGWNALTAPFPGPSPTPCVTKSLTTLTPQDVTVRVYNGGSETGKAGEVAQVLKAAGFKVAKTTNTKESVTKTIIRSGQNNTDAAKLVASYLQGSPTPATDDRVDGTVDVLIGSEYQGTVESGLTEVQVESGSICLAPSPSPSALPS